MVSSGLVVFMGEPTMSVKVKRTIAVPPSSRKHFPTLTALRALRIRCWRWTRASPWPTFVRFASPGQKWRNEGCSPSACAWTQDSVLPPSSSACRRRRAGGTVNREERVIDHYNNEQLASTFSFVFKMFFWFLFLHKNIDILKQNWICKIPLLINMFILFHHCDLIPTTFLMTHLIGGNGKWRKHVISSMKMKINEIVTTKICLWSLMVFDSLLKWIFKHY